MGQNQSKKAEDPETNTIRGPSFDQADGASFSRPVHDPKHEPRRHSCDSNNSKNTSQLRPRSSSHGSTKFLRVENKVEHVQNIMFKNINKACERGEELEILEKRSDDLLKSAKQLAQTTNKLTKKYKAHNSKSKIILCLVGASFLFAMLAVVTWFIYSHYKQSPNRSKADIPFIISVTCAAMAFLILLSALMTYCLYTPESHKDKEPNKKINVTRVEKTEPTCVIS